MRIVVNPSTSNERLKETRQRPAISTREVAEIERNAEFHSLAHLLVRQEPKH
jgi:hypothetical protein